MGSLCSTKKSAAAPPKKQPPAANFGRDPALDPRDFMLAGATDEVLVKAAGTLKGQQFLIEDCARCGIFLLDHSAAVTVDNCRDCRIIVGPCEGSVFLRDCTGCEVVVVAQQLRLRGCTGVDIAAHTSTGPIIESSADVSLTSCRIAWTGLAAQLEQAGLTPWDNQWYNVHDFTPGEADHYRLAPPSPRLDRLRVPSDAAASEGVGEGGKGQRLLASTGPGHRPAGPGVDAFLLISVSDAARAVPLILSERSLTVVQSKTLKLEDKQVPTLFGGAAREWRARAAGSRVLGLDLRCGEGLSADQLARRLCAGGAAAFAVSEPKRESLLHTFFRVWGEGA